MNMEIFEARREAEFLLSQIDLALEKLNSAKNWGLFDIFGGGLFASFIKRGKMKDANYHIENIREGLPRLRKELSDIDINLDTIGDGLLENLGDIWFDNIFVDFMVQKQINHARWDLENLREVILRVLGMIGSP